jgi:hypothetical protein
LRSGAVHLGNSLAIPVGGDFSSRNNNNINIFKKTLRKKNKDFANPRHTEAGKLN